MKPGLPPYRFDKLMKLVSPPSCECKWIEVANALFSLTTEQQEQLKSAKRKTGFYLAGEFQKGAERNGWAWVPRTLGKGRKQ